MELKAIKTGHLYKQGMGGTGQCGEVCNHMAFAHKLAVATRHAVAEGSSSNRVAATLINMTHGKLEQN